MALGEIVNISAEKYPDKEAVFFEQESLTYQRLGESINKLANSLIRLGVKKGMRVGLLLPNSISFVVAYLGIVKCGAIVVPLNTLFKAEELKYILEDSGASFLITSSYFLPVIEKIVFKINSLNNIVMIGEVKEGFISFAELLNKGEDISPSVVINDTEDIAAILYTSGTTGKPKGAMLTHSNLLSNVSSIYEALKCNDKDRFLCVLPLFHSFAATVCMLESLYAGGSMVIMSRFNPEEVLRTIANKKVTIFAGVPSMYAVWASMPKLSLDFSSWRLCISGGAALPQEVMRRFEEKYPVLIYEGDGPTECSPATSFNPIDGKRKPGSIGLPIPKVQMKIVDDNDNDLGPHQTGEIVVKGPNVMKGYWNLPEETHQALKGGWFHTGDIGEVDEEGYFYITDRKKDMIIVGGMNVYPREVEEVLYRHPKVKEAAVIGIKDELRGEIPKAFVVLKDSEEKITEREIINFCRERLAKFKVPRVVEFKESLPKTATGKILKRALREA
ncbi:MAG TPA: long-chain fatty acid--CoA ligase [Candidatus Omnitrophica bacterium]|nr:long-chain fatty acid--CoA ligase [Candidatus Omnitrophota bacterium]